jgi:hypothetical protein
VVVLVFCVDNDHQDNSSNTRYDDHYKPYFISERPDGTLKLNGVPAPRSRHAYFSDNWLARNFWVGRAAVSLYLRLRYPSIRVEDPTNQLIGLIRNYVEERGARFLVALQRADPPVQDYLREQAIPVVTLGEVEAYTTGGGHWTPNGHATVAAELMPLLGKVVTSGHAVDNRR